MNMQNFINIMSALSDPNRLRLLMSLSKRELCVCNLVEFIGLADSTVSKHMSILRQAGLVDARKKGRWVYYRIADNTTSPVAKRVIELASEHLSGDRIVVADAARILELLNNDDGSMCQPEAASCTVRKPDTEIETA
jgi:ArsR family transcriptional regulator, arsenate/arsenite/antimonite-responsive transcriptional repressor